MANKALSNEKSEVWVLTERVRLHSHHSIALRLDSVDTGLNLKLLLATFLRFRFQTSDAAQQQQSFVCSSVPSKFPQLAERLS